jgi:hypothetical protein
VNLCSAIHRLLLSPEVHEVDDWYSPDSTIGCLLNHFNDAYDAGKLSSEVADFLHTAWAEVLQFESKTGYGIPSTDLKM